MIEVDHPIPVSREVYRYRPWYERPLTERQTRYLMTGVLVVVVALFLGIAVVVAVLGVWLAIPLALLGAVVAACLGRDEKEVTR